MEYIKVLLISLLSLIVLFLLTKLMGKRQLSELSMFDYIIGISIGSIAAEMATETQDNFIKPLIAMIVYAVVSTLIAILNDKSLMLRKIFEGKPTILFQNGKMFKNNMKKAKIDVNEFLSQARTNGYFDISEIDSAILETNGKISFLPLAVNRPATPKDMGISVQSAGLVANVVIDGKIQTEVLKSIGKDEKWLKDEISKQNAKISEILLATSDNNNKVCVYKKENKNNKNDIFEQK